MRNLLNLKNSKTQGSLMRLFYRWKNAASSNYGKLFNRINYITESKKMEYY